MPTVMRILGTLWIVHTRDHGYPHVTVYKGFPKSFEAIAKVRLDRIEIIESQGFSKTALSRILRMATQYQAVLLEAWNEVHKEKK